MCGRYVTPDEALIERYWHLGSRNAPNPFGGSYNAAPTQMLPIVRVFDSGERMVTLMRWGLIPSWAKDQADGAKMINARAETIREKPAFKAAYRARRCIVPARGFYEWRNGPSGKQPYYVTRSDGDPMAFAGLWERWQPDGKDAVESYAIITTAANEAMAQLHDRMPAILGECGWEAWLMDHDPYEMLQPCPPEWLAMHPVSSRVNSPGNDDAGLIEAVD